MCYRVSFDRTCPYLICVFRITFCWWCKCRWIARESHTREIADMSHSMTHIDWHTWHIEWHTWHASSSVFQSRMSIAYMCLSNDTCRYLTCVFRKTFYCLVAMACHKSHVSQSHVTITCATHVLSLDNRLSRDVLVTQQSIGTNRPSIGTNQ